uniref:Flavin-containing monooxygenase n=2 Tax=Sarcophilus harrisii TaxID=9305 RepID=A0A7N4V2U7_SARHA
MQETMVKRVAIVGAGVSGLTSIKSCLEEGLEPTCFERSDDIGGLWKFTETIGHGMTKVYKSVVTNITKEMSCYSDFPFPENFPNYMKHTMVMEYLRSYAEHFDLLRCIHFKTTVKSITKHQDFAVTGQWDVVTETEGKQDTATFDAVMICTGHYLNPRLPLESFPGINKFQGQILHSQEYRSPESFQGKRIIVIGLGNTGGDIAVELSRVAEKVFLSTRSGAWVDSRLSDDGYPTHMIQTTRFLHLVARSLPSTIVNWMGKKRMSRWFNHKTYGLSNPKGRLQKRIANDELPTYILCGSVTMKINVKEFTETSAIFEDGTVEENIDVVFFATGYTYSLPFFEEPMEKFCKNKIFIYKFIFPSNLEKATLALIGHVGLQGSVIAGTELQARWATRVFKGLCKIPPSSKMMAEATKKEQLIKRGVIKDTTQEKQDYITYLDELARCTGVKPNILLLFLKDPRLAKEVFFGPCTSYQYRLMGPGKWDGARKAIMTQWDRTLKPLQTRVIPDYSEPTSISYWLKVWGPPVLFVAVLLTYKSSLQLQLMRITEMGERISTYIASTMRK